MKTICIIALLLMMPEAFSSQARRRLSFDYMQTGSARPYDYRRTDSARPYDYRRTNSAREYEQFGYEEKQRAEETNKRTQEIAKKFNMNDDEMFTSESFKELASRATPFQSFYLAVIPAAKGNYHFFSATELAAYLNTSGKSQNPMNRQPIQQIFIYRYNGEEKANFPFDLVETINSYQLQHFKTNYGTRRASL